MSVVIVSKRDIDVLIRACVVREMLGGISPTRAGIMLWSENVRAHQARYSGAERWNLATPEEWTLEDGTINFQGLDSVLTYVYSKWNGKASDSEVLSAAERFDYQCIESSDYHERPAGRLVDSLMRALAAAGVRPEGASIP